MPVRRHRSPIHAIVSTPRPTITIPTPPSTSFVSYPAAKNQALVWLSELHQDTDPMTGYLVENPSTFYGKRTKEFVRYTCNQSTEVKSILTSRRIRTTPLCMYLMRVLRFLADYVIPVIVALGVSISYYIHTPFLITEGAEEPFPPFQNATTWIETASHAGDWFGETIRHVAAVPLSFLSSTIDGSLHVSQGLGFLRQRTELIVYTPLLFVASYCVTLVTIRFFLNLYTICSAEQALWNYQELILRETAQGIERAITGLLRPALIQQYEAFALGIRGLYADSFSTFHMSLYERLITGIKAKPLAELMALGNISSHYIHSLHMLIRHADNELSAAMFQFTNDLHMANLPRRQETKIEDAIVPSRQVTT